MIDNGIDWVDCYLEQNNCFYAEVINFDYGNEWSRAMQDIKEKLNKQDKKQKKLKGVNKQKGQKGQKGQKEQKKQEVKLRGKSIEKSIVYTGSPVKTVVIGYEDFINVNN